MLRKIISIDEEKCNGCEDCIPSCPEGAIKVIEGKARLISDLFCDGLGACLGQCPEGAITIEEREASPYDERHVVASISQKGPAVIKAHLGHLKEHNEMSYLQQALDYLRGNNIRIDFEDEKRKPAPAPFAPAGCPGAQVVHIESGKRIDGDVSATRASMLTHWPIQLHLISPMAPHFQGSNLLFAADCVAFTIGDFHKDHLRDKTLAIGCPKLDNNQDTYLAKLTALIDDARVSSLTVMIMQVPCCTGLLRLAMKAVDQATRKLPIQYRVVGLKGEILQEGQA